MSNCSTNNCSSGNSSSGSWTKSTCVWKDFTIFLLRLAIFVSCFEPGYNKLFGGGMTPVGLVQGSDANFIGFIASLGVPLPTLSAWLVALIEFGSIFVLLGLFTRYAAMAQLPVMLGAIILVHAGKMGFSPFTFGGVSAALSVFAMSFYVAYVGSGGWGIDKLLCKKSCN